MGRHGPWLDVDLGALVRNARRFESVVGVPLLPMVKADSYGLGALAVTRVLEPLRPWGYGVASIEEAVRLRDGGIERPIIAFLPCLPDQVDDYLAYDVRPAIGMVALLESWLAATDRPFHLSIDTGMGRTGFRWYDAAALDEVAALVSGAPGYEGAFTHFATADGAESSVADQWSRFQGVIRHLGAPPLVHAANSAAAQWAGRYAGTLARPGIFLYGGRAGSLVPEPVAALRARVLAVRSVRAGDPVSYGAAWVAPSSTDIATLGIGYADGVRRALAPHGRVAIGGTEYPVAGRITMDMVMVACPEGRVRVGDIATIWGLGAPTLDDQAGRAGTISYELLTGVGPRVVRRYGGNQ